jgi:multicomponent Na+:H+ antiporter subunit C
LFVLALARRQQVLTGDDLVEDDVEDRRIATTEEAAAESLDETRELESLHDNPEGAS